MTRLRQLHAARFRGARFELSLDFTKHHKSIAIYGENASGKSTITDALEWFIMDRVGHLWREDCRHAALRHVHCDEQDGSSVTIQFDGKDRSGTKTLSADLKTSLACDGDDFPGLVERLKDDRIFLRHSQITRFLDSTKSDKRKAIASIIGYDEIIQFRDAIQQTRNALQRDPGYASAKGQMESLQGKMVDLVGEVVSEFDRFHEIASERTKPYGLETAINDAASYVAAIQELRSRAADPKKIQAAEKLKQLERHCSTLKTEIAEVQSALDAFAAPYARLTEERANVRKLRIGDFLSRGKNVLEEGLFTDAQCPFCLTDYDLETLKVEVKARLLEIATLQQQHDAVKGAKERLLEAVATVGKHAGEVAKEFADIPQFSTFLFELRAATDPLRTLYKQVRDRFETLDAYEPDEALAANLAALSDAVKSSAEQAKEEAGKLELTEQEKSITELITTLQQLEQHLRDYRENHKKRSQYEQQILTLSAMFEAFIKVQNDALQDVLDTVSEDVGRFYGRLHPNESVDKVRLRMVGEEGVEFEFSFHGKVTHPPHKYLSESHINSLGIVLFLSNARIFNKHARFMVLDDIVTSFDIRHRRRLLRLLKEEFADWQIILLTHEAIWFDLIKKELAESGWLFKEVLADNENGIMLDDSPATFRALIEKKRGKHDVTNDLRKLLESLLKQICHALQVRVAFRYNDVNEKRMPDELLSQLRSTLKSKSRATSELPIFSDLAGSALIANVDSHDNPDPISTEDVDVLFEDIEKLASLFICNVCAQPVRADAVIPGDKKIACRCGALKLDWVA
ncbi:AAA family ATPase [Nitratireductor mangrovi]|uniref:AAA family ATPase n=1 Tax=Nitratireductor mangrovi TaxID=2599600 RepID=A0A5B8KXD6_9HYPH|nr:AAA family ATPase [Nitratireductor mangrovi]QDZ00239.1 AAA family ATPase [Nitratireductor mangrovi]